MLPEETGENECGLATPDELEVHRGPDSFERSPEKPMKSVVGSKVAPRPEDAQMIKALQDELASAKAALGEANLRMGRMERETEDAVRDMQMQKNNEICVKDEQIVQKDEQISVLKKKLAHAHRNVEQLHCENRRAEWHAVRPPHGAAKWDHPHGYLLARSLSPEIRRGEGRRHKPSALAQHSLNISQQQMFDQGSKMFVRPGNSHGHHMAQRALHRQRQKPPERGRSINSQHTRSQYSPSRSVSPSLSRSVRPNTFLRQIGDIPDLPYVPDNPSVATRQRDSVLGRGRSPTKSIHFL